jgi:heme O synthase-like polyprenyltransferase
LRYEKLRDQEDREGTKVAIDLTGGSPEMDYPQAEKTYKQFLLLTKIVVVFLVVLLAGMGYFLT